MVGEQEGPGAEREGEGGALEIESSDTSLAGMTDETDIWLANLDGAFENFDHEDAEVTRCKEAVRVPRVPYSSLSTSEFHERFSKTNTPIILGDAWDTIPAHLDLNYWRENHSDALVPLDLGTSSERLVKLGDYIKFEDKEMSKGYCRSLHTQVKSEETSLVLTPSL